MERRCSLIVGTTYWTPLSEKRPAKHFYRRCRGTSDSTCGFSFKKSHAEKVPALYCNGRNAPKVLGAAAHSSRPSISIGDDCFPTFEMARPIFALHRETRKHDSCRRKAALQALYGCCMGDRRPAGEKKPRNPPARFR